MTQNAILPLNLVIKVAKQRIALCCRAVALVLAVCLPLSAQALEQCDALSLQQLVQLMDDRLALADDVARYKWTTRMPIEDLAREQAIIQHLGRQAAGYGLPVGWAEAFFRAQFAASKSVQSSLFATWRNTHPNGFKDPPHLTRTTRPKLDAINRQLFSLLASSWEQLDNPACQPLIADLVARQIAVSTLTDPSALTLATAPLTAAVAK